MFFTETGVAHALIHFGRPRPHVVIRYAVDRKHRLGVLFVLFAVRARLGFLSFSFTARRVLVAAARVNNGCRFSMKRCRAEFLYGVAVVRVSKHHNT